MRATHDTVFQTNSMTPEIEAAKRFFEKICSWTFTSVPMGEGSPNYALGMKGEKPLVGLMDRNKLR